jgi:hypothetical protein
MALHFGGFFVLAIQCLALSKPGYSATKKHKDFDSRTKALYIATEKNSDESWWTTTS